MRKTTYTEWTWQSLESVTPRAISHGPMSQIISAYDVPWCQKCGAALVQEMSCCLLGIIIVYLYQSWLIDNWKKCKYFLLRFKKIHSKTPSAKWGRLFRPQRVWSSCYDMETISAILAFCDMDSPHKGTWCFLCCQPKQTVELLVICHAILFWCLGNAKDRKFVSSLSLSLSASFFSANDQYIRTEPRWQLIIRPPEYRTRRGKHLT